MPSDPTRKALKTPQMGLISRQNRKTPKMWVMGRFMVKKNEKTLLQWASEYHRRGWCIIPVGYETKKPPLVKWTKYQTQRASEKQIRQWFSNGNRNIAVIFGEVSNGLTCRDFDTMAEYQLWARNYPDLAKMLPTVQTSQGMHVYFEGHFEGIKHISNGELRGSGGYCLLPPSKHPDGKIYQWVNPLLNGNLLAIDPELAGFIPDVTKRTKRTKRIKRTNENQGELKEIEGDGEVEQAIIETLPSKYGTRHRQIFEFARCIRSLPQYTDADPTQIRSFVEEWHKQALPYIRTKEFEETWIDFVLGWKKVKNLIGKEPMTQIFERAKESEPPKIAIEKYPNNPKLQLFATVCRELQVEAGEGSFYLYCKTGSKYLEVSAMSISRWFTLLGIDNIVREIEKGGIFWEERNGKKTKVKKPSRYKYIAN